MSPRDLSAVPQPGIGQGDLYPAEMPLEQRVPVGAVPVPKHEHDWVESVRFLPFAAADLEGFDTDEPPKDADGKPLTRHDPETHGELDPEQHYRVTPPGPEIVYTCSVCTDTRVAPVKKSAYRAFAKRMQDGELQPEHVSLLPLERLLGDEWEAGAK